MLAQDTASVIRTALFMAGWLAGRGGKFKFVGIQLFHPFSAMLAQDTT